MLCFNRSRRQFLWHSSTACLTASALRAADARPRRPKVAAVFTVLRFRSHAFNILENLVGPYLFNGERHMPRVEVASLYADQFPDDDMAREVSTRLRIPLFKTIDEALCLGGRSLAVDAVLSIGEHGEYPLNERGQTLYPRKRFFDQAVSVMQRNGRYVPLFNDKHLSYRWDWAKAMYDTARQHAMPMLAGSSVPLAERRPPLELPQNAAIDEALAVHGGGFESYDFHGLELLQSFVESRSGGETGIEKVEFLVGDAFQQAKNHRWSEDLALAALQAEQNLGARRQPRPTVGVFAAPSKPDRKLSHPSTPYAICLTYRDGLRGTVLGLGGGSDRWLFACRLRGESAPRATAMYNGPWGNRCLFMALTHAIEHLFVTAQEPYPLARTLLTTGALEAAVRSHDERRPIDTPHLLFAYRADSWQAFREQGQSWRVLSSEKPQPTTIDPQRFGENSRERRAKS